jgi:hypothetical protein
MTFLIFLGFFALTGLIIGVLSALFDEYYVDASPHIGMGILGGIVAGAISTFLYVESKRSDLKVVEKPYLKYSLVSLDANEDVNGSYAQSFFVGSGYIGEDLYYHFFYNTSKGIKYEKRRAERVYIIETDTIVPSYIEYGYFFLEKDSLEIGYYPEMRSRSRDVLYIPEGTIKRDYKVN